MAFVLAPACRGLALLTVLHLRAMLGALLRGHRRAMCFTHGRALFGTHPAAVPVIGYAGPLAALIVVGADGRWFRLRALPRDRFARRTGSAPGALTDAQIEFVIRDAGEWVKSLIAERDRRIAEGV